MQLMSVETIKLFTLDEQGDTPLIHCSVDNILIKVTPLFNLSFFQMTNVVDLAS